MTLFLERVIARIRARLSPIPGKAGAEPPRAVVSAMLRRFADEPESGRNRATEAEIQRTYQESEAALRNMRS